MVVRSKNDFQPLLWMPKMTMKLRIRQIGNQVGVAIPKNLLDELGVKTGDSLVCVRTQTGLHLTAPDKDMADATEDALDYMHRHSGAMKALSEN